MHLGWRLGMAREEITVCKKQNNIYVVEVNMTEKTVEEIAREAALKIIGITDALIEREKRAKEEAKEEKQ